MLVNLWQDWGGQATTLLGLIPSPCWNARRGWKPLLGLAHESLEPLRARGGYQFAPMAVGATASRETSACATLGDSRLGKKMNESRDRH